MASADVGSFILGNYRLIEVLGIGAMGYIYRARQLNLDRDVAVKILSPTLAHESDYLELFIREARTAASLEHPHIVPVIDYGVQQNVSYVAMRLLPGGSLGDRIEYLLRHHLPLPSLSEIALLLTQTASALDYAHGRGVIHRDIKPNNLVFDQHGVLYIVDFGIAKLMGTTSSIKGSTFLGTPSFMAPEQWQGLSPTPAVDQYALGAVVYMMITGHPPFESEIALALMTKHLNEMPSDIQLYRPNAPAQINAILQRAMAKQPDARYPNNMAFAREFAAAVSEAQDEAPTEFATFNFPLATYQIPFPTPLNLPLATVDVGTSQPSDSAKAVSASPGTSQNVLLWVLGGLVGILAIALIALIISRQSIQEAATPTLIAGFSVIQSETPTPTDVATELRGTEETIPPFPSQLTVRMTETARWSTLRPTMPPTITGSAPDASTTVLINTQPTAASITSGSAATTTAAFTPSPTTPPTETYTTTAAFTSSPTFTRTPTVTDRKPTATRTLSPTPTMTGTETLTPSLTPTFAARPTVNWRAGTQLRINNPNGVWLRRSASTRAGQVTTLANNNSVTATGRNSFDGRQWWWEVRSSWGAEGWVEQYSLTQP